MIVAQLQENFPGAIAGFKIAASAPATFHVYGGDTARVTAEGTVMFFVDDPDTDARTWLLALKLDLSAQMSVEVNGSRILFDVNYIECATTNLRPNVPNVSTSGLFVSDRT